MTKTISIFAKTKWQEMNWWWSTTASFSAFLSSFSIRTFNDNTNSFAYALKPLWKFECEHGHFCQSVIQSIIWENTKCFHKKLAPSSKLMTVNKQKNSLTFLLDTGYSILFRFCSEESSSVVMEEQSYSESCLWKKTFVIISAIIMLFLYLLIAT